MTCIPACRTCHALMEASLRVVGERGAAGLTDEALEREAGLARGEVRAHYPTAAACLHATYEEVSGRLADELVGGFGATTSWYAAFAAGRRALLARLAAHPAEARLCFVETLRGDRELRRRRERRRRWLVDFLAAQQRDVPREALSKLQIELLVGATFQEISTAVAAGATEALPSLEPRLSVLAGLFGPSLGRRSLASPVGLAWSAQ